MSARKINTALNYPKSQWFDRVWTTQCEDLKYPDDVDHRPSGDSCRNRAALPVRHADFHYRRSSCDAKGAQIMFVIVVERRLIPVLRRDSDDVSGYDRRHAFRDEIPGSPGHVSRVARCRVYAFGKRDGRTFETGRGTERSAVGCRCSPTSKYCGIRPCRVSGSIAHEDFSRSLVAICDFHAPGNV